MTQKQADDIRQSARESHAIVAEAGNAGQCHGVASSGCGVSSDINSLQSTRPGYSAADPDHVPDSAWDWAVAIRAPSPRFAPVKPWWARASHYMP